ncbi:MAG: FkbM family methyltransferase [Isosphaerales bacterium]
MPLYERLASSLIGTPLQRPAEGLRRLWQLPKRLRHPERRIGFLKIDVEGAEFHVLRGARRVLGESQPIVLFECAREGLTNFGLTASQFFSLLTRASDITSSCSKSGSPEVSPSICRPSKHAWSILSRRSTTLPPHGRVILVSL